MLTLFLYIAKTVCRDLHLTVTCRILKVCWCLYTVGTYRMFAVVFTCFVSLYVQIRVLTELRMFSQAVEELNSLTLGEEIPLHHGGNHRGIGEPSRVQQHIQWTTNSDIKKYMQLSTVHIKCHHVSCDFIFCSFYHYVFLKCIHSFFTQCDCCNFKTNISSHRQEKDLSKKSLCWIPLTFRSACMFSLLYITRITGIYHRTTKILLLYVLSS